MKVLQFSGGKDSIACLYVLKPIWDELTVVWVNTGAAFPETEAQMAEIRKLVPKFLEIRTSQNIAEKGFPSDMPAPGFQDRNACCGHALWAPTYAAMKSLGATTVYRGQKNADALKSPIRSGAEIDGITYIFPLEGWTDADVYEFLKDIPLPRNYPEMNTSLDCWNCTAYLAENGPKLGYLKRYHPGKYAVVAERLNAQRTRL